MLSTSRHRSAAIVGAGAGLGRELALGLAAKGYIVYGTAISANEVRDLKEASGGRVSLAVCEVTRIEGIQTWAEGVSDALDGAGLNILFSNISRCTLGPIEILPLEDIRREFEVNVFGALSIIRAFLPALRTARGRIIQINDWTATIALPFDGPSGASKAAIDALSNVYRAELEPFGIDVVVASTGIATSIGSADIETEAARVKRKMTREQSKLYGKTFDTFTKALIEMQESEMGVTVAASRLIAIAEQQPAPIRAAVTSDAEDLLQAVRLRSDTELDVLRRELVGFKLSAAGRHLRHDDDERKI